MESNYNTLLQWLPRVEQDFPFGAKASTCLPSANAETTYKNETYDLPDWMESRENFGLSDVDLFEEMKMEGLDVQFDSLQQNISYDTCDADMEEVYTSTIKPEDMLVPLCELQPDKYGPQSLRANTLSVSFIPKVSIRVNRIQVPKQDTTKSLPYFEAPQNASIQNSSSQILQPVNYNNIPYESFPSYNAEELINELVDMASDEPNGLTDLISSFDASVVQAGMNDLLSQLESGDVVQKRSDISTWSSEPASPVQQVSDISPCSSEPASPVQQVSDISPCSSQPASPVSLPSPVPSMGSLSHQSTNDVSFQHLLTPTYISEESSDKLEHDQEPSFVKILSPSSVESGSISSPAYIDEESDVEYSNPEIHSYSRLPNKRKTTRKSSGRKTAIPEGRKERKKEQNKQAALRYRQKKKLEDDDLSSKIVAEEERQKKLKARYADLKQELTYLKKIMREVLIANGTISPEAFKK